ncbi:MAG: hypothetical protein LBJ64_12370, partial [Deltaproteobacteria bacterium]|nr:hypothetical protein [Deltaproteobacteria bacterium]
ALVSYADPIAAPKIIGPKYSRSLADMFLKRFLGRMQEVLQGTTTHLCPNVARLLTNCGLGRWSPVSVSPGLGYQESCLELAGKVGFLGQACLKRLNFSLPDFDAAELKLDGDAAELRPS